MDVATLKSNLLEFVKSHKSAADVLRKVDGKRDYKAIATELDIHPTQCSRLLSNASHFGLLVKDGSKYKKSDDLKRLDVSRLIREAGQPGDTVRQPAVRRTAKRTDTGLVRTQLTGYLWDSFRLIDHPFSRQSYRMSDKTLSAAVQSFVAALDARVDIEQLRGLPIRFYDAFAGYFSVSRTNKAELLNAFRAIVGCYEPYLKKLAFLRTGDPKRANLSLSNDLLLAILPFDGNVNEARDDYWRERPITEACIRVVFPFRHKESHESRDYPTWEMERVVFYMFASLMLVHADAKGQPVSGSDV